MEINIQSKFLEFEKGEVKVKSNEDKKGEANKKLGEI